MRHLTASQKIARLEQRIARLEREASSFGDFGRDVLEVAAEEIRYLLSLRFGLKTSPIKLIDRGQVRSAVSTLSRSFETVGTLTVRIKRDRLVAFITTGAITGYEVLGNVKYFAMDSRASTEALIKEVKDSLRRDSSLDLFFDTNEL